MSPSITSSPVISAFPDTVKAARASPAPSTTARPASSRARQNSVHSNIESAKQRPPSSASKEPNGTAPAPVEVNAVQSNGSRPPPEPKVVKEAPAPIKGETPKPENDAIIAAPPLPASTSRKESVSKPVEEAEISVEPTAALPIATTTLVTTKSGRASKPSTPALATFAEAARSRPSRASEGTATVKRSHKKGASAAAAAAAQRALAQQLEENDSSHVEDEENEIDENEPTYCYCNGVSYGEMVGCDGPDCKREWFHLECVGLKVAPKSNGKHRPPGIASKGETCLFANALHSEMVLRGLQKAAQTAREEGQWDMRLSCLLIEVTRCLRSLFFHHTLCGSQTARGSCGMHLRNGVFARPDSVNTNCFWIYHQREPGDSTASRHVIVFFFFSLLSFQANVNSGTREGVLV